MVKGSLRITTWEQMEMSANRLMWPFGQNMTRRRQSGESVGVTVCDSLLGLTQGSHYRNNASDAADINAPVASSCSADRCSHTAILISQQIDLPDCSSSSH